MEISIPDFYSRFLETQDFMFPTFIQKIATLTENRFCKKNTILNGVLLLLFSRTNSESQSGKEYIKNQWGKREIRIF